MYLNSAEIQMLPLQRRWVESNSPKEYKTIGKKVKMHIKHNSHKTNNVHTLAPISVAPLCVYMHACMYICTCHYKNTRLNSTWFALAHKASLTLRQEAHKFNNEFKVNMWLSVRRNTHANTHMFECLNTCVCLCLRKYCWHISLSTLSWQLHCLLSAVVCINFFPLCFGPLFASLPLYRALCCLRKFCITRFLFTTYLHM